MKPFTFNATFRYNVATVAENLGLVSVTTRQQANNGTLMFYDPKTDVRYSLHESGYIRRYIKTSTWSRTRDFQENELQGYQLNTVKRVKGKYGYRTHRELATPYEQLGIFVKSVISYRG